MIVKEVLDLSQLPERGEIVIDADGHVMGRLASYVAKILLSKPELQVIVVNAEKLVITGDRKMIMRWFMRKISEWRTHYNPEKVGPKIPRRPDRVFKRVVRGMLPKKIEKGRNALKRLRVYMSIPLDFLQRRRLVLYEVPAAKLKVRPLMQYVTLEEVWRIIDPATWEKWNKAKELWAKKIKQVAGG